MLYNVVWTLAREDWLIGDMQVTYFKKRRVFEHQKEETIRRLEGEGVQGRENSAGGTAAKALRGSR